MTPAEVEAVLALWRDVEGTQPPRLKADGAGYFIRPWDGAVIHDDDSSDIICGHLRRWMEARCYRIDIAIVATEVAVVIPTEVRMVTNPDGSVLFRTGSTLLLALIAAVRAVAGTSNTPTAADAAGETK